MNSVRYRVIGILFLVLWCSHSFAGEEYWQQYVHYDFNVTLDVEKHALSGDAIITYKNNSPDTLDRIYLHLYPNAFRDENSTLSRESRRYYSGAITPENNGYIDILEFRITRKDASANVNEAPVVAYHVKDTILESMLPEALRPGEELQLYVKFYEKISSLVRRGGWRGNQYDISQWYPKLVVYDQKGWHADEYHASGEFYGEFATFDVAINLPYNYIVGATGVPVAGDPGWTWVQVDTCLSDAAWDSAYVEMKAAIEARADQGLERTVKFHAENVHDFAWLACPDFLYERGEWNGIPVHVLYRSQARHEWTKVVAQRGENVLKWLSEKYGMYPYPQLSITHGLLGGGMEYPMLVMNSGPWEGLISHEVGHIYFYGLFASDELAEAWMDEGGTSYQEYWYQVSNYGPYAYEGEEEERSGLQKLYPRIPRKEREAFYLTDYMTSGYNEPMSQYAHEFKGGYGINAYSKGAWFYAMLHYIVGDSLWGEINHAYFDRWAFKHVNEQRFREVCEDVSGMDLGWFFDQWLHNTVGVDYSLGKISKTQEADGRWRTDVRIKRNDAGIMPVDVQVTTENGEKFVQRWDGKDKFGLLTFYTAAKPGNVVLDPEDNVLDRNRLNNGGWKIQLLPDLPHAWDYTPRNVYLVKYTPKFWYNDVDGLWLGLRLRGNYMQKFNRSELGLTYGLLSNDVGFNVAFGHPLLPNSEKLQFDVSGVKREGRAIGELGFTYRTGSEQNAPLVHQFNIAFNAAQLLKGDEAYAVRRIRVDGHAVHIPEWELGRVHKIMGSYRIEGRRNRWSTSLGLTVESSQAMWGSEFDYWKFSGQAKMRYVFGLNQFACRLFGGAFSGDDAPIQELFYTDGANPRERFQTFYLRSLAAFPAEANYHFPGGGNLRGFIDHPSGTEQIAALNAEASFGCLMPLARKVLPRRWNIQLSTFYDVARIEKSVLSDDTLMDAGVGLKLNAWMLSRRVTMRFDFPIWVNHPMPGDKETEFRWLFSFQNAI
ncbi:MAG: M1 family aminopeptidase [Candidatus Zhuqueibacterota bacterium]